MSVQPQWVTAAGNLGTIPEGVFYSVPVQAVADDQDVYFKLIAGELPSGIQVTSNGLIQGTPKNLVSIQGVPTEVNEDVTSKFAIRAYTTKVVDNLVVIDRLADRTFSITVSGQNPPDFVTPAGLIGTYYDCTEVDLQIAYTDRDPNDKVTISLLTGQLPPGLVLSPTGQISGVIEPLVGPAGTAPAGYSATQFDQYPFDFATRAASRAYQFTLRITDGKDSNLRTFSIYVYARDTMTADAETVTPLIDPNTQLVVYNYAPMSADNTFITADETPNRTPVLLTPQGSLGRIRCDNFYAFKFDAIDCDGDPIEYSLTVGPGIGFDATGTTFDENGIGFDRGDFSLPPGLTLNPTTGWFYGYIPDQGFTETTYRFAIRVYKANDPSIISDFYYYTITIIGNIDTEVIWLTDPDLGTINNGAISTLAVEAYNLSGRALQYQLAPGYYNRLPQGLTLQPTGHITGRVSFNTFALDGGTTTFDRDLNTRLNIDQTTFDLTCRFTVNAFAPQTITTSYEVIGIEILNGGNFYTSQPTVLISSPPPVSNAVQATAGLVTIIDNKITAIAVGNPGRGYVTPPTITITGGGGVGATARAIMQEVTQSNAISVYRTFTVVINRAFNEPYEDLYIKAMPSIMDRELVLQLTQDQDIFQPDLIYRADDPNFGVAQNVIYTHAYGLTAATIEQYVESLQLNHYWKNITLGEIKSARALDTTGRVIYEAIYSEVIDDLVNNDGQSVGKEVSLAYPVTLPNDTETSVVYPNSLVDMRTQVIDTVGQVSPALPAWMTSKQVNGRVLGFVPAWVIAYAKPGQASRIIYNIQQKFGTQLNKVDFKIDRYELDRSQTHNYDPYTEQWIPHPPLSTTFDVYRDIEYTTPGLGTNGRIGQTDQFLADGVSNRYRIDLLPSTDKVMVTVNGSIQTYNSDFTVTYGTLPVYVILNNTPNVVTTNYNGDGSTTAFAYTALSGRGLQVYLGLNLQTQGVDYTLAFNQVIFNTSPPNGYTVRIQQPSIITVYQIKDQYVLDPNGTTATPTVFDGGGTTFNSPADRWTNTDAFDKYLVFPKTNILGR